MRCTREAQNHVLGLTKNVGHQLMFKGQSSDIAATQSPSAISLLFGKHHSWFRHNASIGSQFPAQLALHAARSYQHMNPCVDLPADPIEAMELDPPQNLVIAFWFCHVFFKVCGFAWLIFACCKDCSWRSTISCAEGGGKNHRSVAGWQKDIRDDGGGSPSHPLCSDVCGRWHHDCRSIQPLAQDWSIEVVVDWVSQVLFEGVGDLVCCVFLGFIVWILRLLVEGCILIL